MNLVYSVPCILNLCKGVVETIFVQNLSCRAVNLKTQSFPC